MQRTISVWSVLLPFKYIYSVGRDSQSDSGEESNEEQAVDLAADIAAEGNVLESSGKRQRSSSSIQTGDLFREWKVEDLEWKYLDPTASPSVNSEKFYNAFSDLVDDMRRCHQNIRHLILEHLIATVIYSETRIVSWLQWLLELKNTCFQQYKRETLVGNNIPLGQKQRTASQQQFWQTNVREYKRSLHSAVRYAALFVAELYRCVHSVKGRIKPQDLNRMLTTQFTEVRKLYQTGIANMKFAESVRASDEKEIWMLYAAANFQDNSNITLPGVEAVEELGTENLGMIYNFTNRKQIRDFVNNFKASKKASSKADELISSSEPFEELEYGQGWIRCDDQRKAHTTTATKVTTAAVPGVLSPSSRMDQEWGIFLVPEKDDHRSIFTAREPVSNHHASKMKYKASVNEPLYLHRSNLVKSPLAIGSSLHSRGDLALFSKKKYKKDEVIAVFEGDLLPIDEWEKKYAKEKIRSYFTIKISTKYVLDCYDSSTRCAAMWANSKEGSALEENGQFYNVIANTYVSFSKSTSLVSLRAIGEIGAREEFVRQFGNVTVVPDDEELPDWQLPTESQISEITLIDEELEAAAAGEC